jgi:hypothetical protein
VLACIIIEFLLFIVCPFPQEIESRKDKKQGEKLGDAPLCLAPFSRSSGV